MKVLVVGSSEGVRHALCAPLLAAGLHVAEASGGQDALERVASGSPDAVLMDAQGGAMDALNLLKRIRGSEARYHLPILMVFDSVSLAERILALKLGADDVLGDSWDADELVARIQRSLTLKQRMDALVNEGRKLELLSVTDGLTQVNNHRFFRERLHAEFRRFQRYEDSLSLLFVDLDHFKDVNDIYGHPTGDQVLTSVAQTIRPCLRDVDILARYGGEEFAVILPQTHRAGAHTVAERIRRDIHGLRMGSDGKLRVTVSIGVASLPNATLTTAEELLGAADAALYRAKREGRNRVLSAPSTPIPDGLTLAHRQETR